MRNIKMVLTLILVILAAGCGEPKVNDDAPKKVVNTYLEGFRDYNPSKVYNSVSNEVYQELRFPPDKLDQLFKAQDKQAGKIQSWAFTGEPYVDEVNNQAILQLTVKTTKITKLVEFDLRRVGDNWYVYGIEQKKSLNSNKKVKK